MIRGPDHAIAEVVEGITAVDPKWFNQAGAHLNNLTKPLGSLGRLEAIVVRMVAIREQETNCPLNKVVYVFAADHGVTAQCGLSRLSLQSRSSPKSMALLPNY